jgi:hypothetical protein
MRKLVFVVGCLLLSASLALAKDKLVSQWNCSAPSEMHAIAVGDKANHSYSISKASCTAAKSEIGGVHEKEATGTQFEDTTGDSVSWHGVFVATADNGDKIHYSYASKGAVTTKDGKFQSGADTWSIIGGTGKFAGAKGEGTCQGKGNPDGTATWDCQGTYTLAK